MKKSTNLPIIVKYQENKFTLKLERKGKEYDSIFSPEAYLNPPIKKHIKCTYVLARSKSDIITGLRKTQIEGLYIGNVINPPKSKTKRSVIIAYCFKRDGLINLTLLFYPNKNPRNKKVFFKNEIVKFKRGFYD